MKIDITKILFLDIETAPVCRRYEELPEIMKKWWDKKSEHLRKKAEDTPLTLYQRAGIYAEFAKVVCISTGYFEKGEHEHGPFHMQSYTEAQENELLIHFSADLNKFTKRKFLLCAHNGKEFDFPFLARRMVINGITLPPPLDNHGKKPWEVNHLDTMELWKFGDVKNYTSLELLAAVLGIPSPKNEMDGSDVARVYWEENDIIKIERYCRQDVIAIAQVMLRFLGLPLMDAPGIDDD